MLPGFQHKAHIIVDCIYLIQRSSIPEPFLSCCVPELQLYTDPRFHLQEVNVEVNTYCLVDGLHKQVLCVAFQ